MNLDRLVGLLVMVSFTFGCDTNSMTSPPLIIALWHGLACVIGGGMKMNESSLLFFDIQGSGLHFHWDFQNMSSNLDFLEIGYNCYNPYVPADGYNEWTTQNLVYSFVLLNISESTLATSCEVCIEGSDANILKTKVSFSFGNYCSNGHYNISSDLQKVVIQSSNVACFSCILPGQKKTDIWEVNGMETALNITAAGSLIVTNPLEVFGGSSMISELTCRNRESNISITALITYNK